MKKTFYKPFDGFPYRFHTTYGIFDNIMSFLSTLIRIDANSIADDYSRRYTQQAVNDERL